MTTPQTTTLGSTGIEVFPLVLGGNTFGWTSDLATSEKVLDAFVEAGGNFIDTADVYSAWAPGNKGGESETILGQWIASRGNRADVVIGTKVSQHPQFPGLKADNIRAAAAESLERLGTDYIDVYYAHFDDESTPLAETAAAFDELVRAGTVRAIGVSNYTGARIREWFEIARRDGLTLPTVLEPHYNLVKREPYESDIAPVAAEENLAVVPYFALASGFLSGKYRTRADLEGAARAGFAESYFTDEGLAVVDQLRAIADARGVVPATVALAWLRGRANVVAPIASARIPEQLPALIASATLTLSDAEVAELDRVSAQIPA